MGGAEECGGHGERDDDDGCHVVSNDENDAIIGEQDVFILRRRRSQHLPGREEG